jgi:hypothetical protein
MPKNYIANSVSQPSPVLRSTQPASHSHECAAQECLLNRLDRSARVFAMLPLCPDQHVKVQADLFELRALDPSELLSDVAALAKSSIKRHNSTT